MAFTSLPKSIKILAAAIHDGTAKREFIRSYIRIAEARARQRSTRSKKDDSKD